MKLVNRFLLIIISFVIAVQAYAEESSQFNFIALADLHLDPFTVCNKKNYCPMIEKLRSSKTEEWPKIFAKYDTVMPKYGEDTTWPLLNSAVSAAGETANKNHA